MVPNSFSKAKHESMEDGACWKAKKKKGGTLVGFSKAEG